MVVPAAVAPTSPPTQHELPVTLAVLHALVIVPPVKSPTSAPVFAPPEMEPPTMPTFSIVPLELPNKPTFVVPLWLIVRLLIVCNWPLNIPEKLEIGVKLPLSVILVLSA